MPDQLSLSLWLRDFDSETMLRHFEELLRLFPFSRLRPGIGALRVYALEYVEPPVFERVYPEEASADEVIAACREFEHEDSAYVVDAWWELFKPGAEGWNLQPSRVTLTCFGPAFDNDAGDHLRIDVGFDTDFLPAPGVPDSDRAARSNLAGLLRLARELETSMPVLRRSLWTESGENFAERVDEELLS